MKNLSLVFILALTACGGGGGYALPATPTSRSTSMYVSGDYGGKIVPDVIHGTAALFTVTGGIPPYAVHVKSGKQCNVNATSTISANTMTLVATSEAKIVGCQVMLTDQNGVGISIAITFNLN